MRKTGLSVVSTLLAIMMVVSGCSGKNNNGGNNQETSPEASQQTANNAQTGDKPDISKEVKLKMYLIGDQPKDTALVYGEINKKLKKDINATVEPVFLSWGEYMQKYPLLFATGEEFDLVYAANWIKYSEQASKGAFMELTPELLNKYAPETMKEMPAEAWEQAKVGGKIYMIPSSNKDYGMVVGAVRGDLREKYNLPQIKTIADYEAYLDAIAKNEPTMVPYDADANTYQTFDMMLTPDYSWKIPVNNAGIAYDVKDPSGTLFNYIETPEYLDFAKKMAEWNKKGYWSKSALTNKTTVTDSFLSGKSASMAGNLTNLSQNVTLANQSHPEWKVEMFNLYEGKPTFPNPYTGNGMAINANSKNAERALMMLDLFRNNEDYFNLTTYGIEGTHYELTADNKIKVLNGAESGFKPDSACPWGWRTPANYKVMADAPAEYASILESFNKNAISNPLLTFVFDSTNFKNELAAIKNVADQYKIAITLGGVSDAEAAVKNLDEKYKEAGMDKVMAEAKKQIEAFLANQKE
jgi:ABC-type sugar transport system, periplasmic component